MALILAYKGRGVTKDITITTAGGAVITPGANDKLRVVIGREGKLGVNFADAELMLTSDAATANGSSITKNYPSETKNRLRLDAADLNFEAGTYTLFVEYFDNADAQEWKNVSRQVFNLQDT